jgi:2,4-dienoyl-CoA reductase (NADPH2)
VFPSESNDASAVEGALSTIEAHRHIPGKAESRIAAVGRRESRVARTDGHGDLDEFGQYLQVTSAREGYLPPDTEPGPLSPPWTRSVGGRRVPRTMTRLLSPLTIRHADGSTTELRNRVLMGSMHTGLEELQGGWARMAAFYAERAAGGVGLIVTGGLSPNAEGNMWAGMRTIQDERDAEPHRLITDAVHAHGALIAMQLLHAGRYATHSQGVAPSALRSPLSPMTPRAMTVQDIERTLNDYAQAARLAKRAGYDGVEVMAAEGYLINQFMAPRTNQRTDDWGGSAENRRRFGVETVRRVRAATGARFLVIVRLSMLDLVEGGCPWEEVEAMAHALQEAGASILNPYVGWHESRVPTIASLVPRGTFTPLTRRLREAVRMPVVASNRINDARLAERLLADGTADLVSMARPLLADPEFVRKLRRGDERLVNTCIACNHCLDEAFSRRLTTCMVNPRACRETEILVQPARRRRRVAVVGAGPAGMACALTAAERGHDVTLYEAAERIGGQFLLACRIPGKEEYAETLRYYEASLQRFGVRLVLGQRVGADELERGGFDHVVLATGVRPRRPDIEGIDHPKVLSYTDVIEDQDLAGRRIAIVGAGGIGFDVAELLTHETLPGDERARFAATWGIDLGNGSPGGLTTPAPACPAREVWLLQRSPGAVGSGLAKTTGWIRRALLRRRGVHMLAGVHYLRIDDRGLHILGEGQPRLLAVDHVVVCAGQEPERSLEAPLRARGISLSLIGGARLANGLNATRAIAEGTMIACGL